MFLLKMHFFAIENGKKRSDSMNHIPTSCSSTFGEKGKYRSARDSSRPPWRRSSWAFSLNFSISFDRNSSKSTNFSAIAGYHDSQLNEIAECWCKKQVIIGGSWWGKLAMKSLTQLSNCLTLEGSFSSVSTATIARKGAFCSIS